MQGGFERCQGLLELFRNRKNDPEKSPNPTSQDDKPLPRQHCPFRSFLTKISLAQSSQYTIASPPQNGAKPSSSRSGRRFASKQISPQVPAGNFEIGEVSYKFNLLKSRGPRRMIQLVFRLDLQEKTSNMIDFIYLRNDTVARATVDTSSGPSLDQSQPGVKGDGETVLLQFEEVGDDVFTMDFRQPLSAFHAFAICLTSLGTRLACE
ncbi:hypothetical protein OSB04_008514 [Centaurea solstitialis]|uniref:Tubby C-terminal domain-containing protein n=1 Tax=Centaurea solstitialis TaxID=347529 RepID=A0AA38TLZ9_9ASTR|nr:hypothetical protein OSB04_008514 [Centaurea solstitialis]